MTILAPAKVNVFLKIVGTRGDYHRLRSRFLRVDELCDRLSFVPKKSAAEGFVLECDSDLPADNTLTRAYDLLRKVAPEVESFFRDHTVKLEKKIPAGAGLGGGSSDAAAFLKLANEVCGLGLSVERLASLGEKIGADVPFFVYGHTSANVSGIGEIIEPFEEEPPKIRIFTPDIHCDTATIYRTFRKKYIRTVDSEAAKGWLQRESADLMRTLDPLDANDLFRPALDLCERLADFKKPGWFFSGSGSSFFRLEKKD